MQTLGFFSSSPAAPRGFSLVELLVCLALIGSLTAFATPHWQRFQEARRVDAARDQLIHDLQSARLRALHHGEAFERLGVRANVVRAGSVGVVAASGTGAQQAAECRDLDARDRAQGRHPPAGARAGWRKRQESNLPGTLRQPPNGFEVRAPHRGRFSSAGRLRR